MKHKVNSEGNDQPQCPICGATFTRPAGVRNKLYCSHRCALVAADRARRARRRAGLLLANPPREVACRECGKSFLSNPRHPTKVFCSSRCCTAFNNRKYQRRHADEMAARMRLRRAAQKSRDISPALADRIRSLQYAAEHGSEPARLALFRLTKRNRHARDFARRAYEEFHTSHRIYPFS